MSGSSFRYVDTRPRSCPQPVGFYRYKAGQVYKPTVPPPDNGAHVKLHRNLTQHLVRPDTVREPKAYGPAFRILYKQRASQRVFSSHAPVDAYSNRDVLATKRLSSYDPAQQPAESNILKDALFYPHVICNKPLYNKQEVQGIVDRLYQRKQREGRCPSATEIDKNRKTFPAEMVDKYANKYTSTTRLCLKTPYRNLFRDRIAAHVVCSTSKQLTEGEFGTMVDRLNEFNTQKWPPNSNYVETEEPGSPEKVLYPPERAQHMNSASIDATVDRLYSGRWRSSEHSNGGEGGGSPYGGRSSRSPVRDGQHERSPTHYDQERYTDRSSHAQEE